MLAANGVQANGMQGLDLVNIKNIKVQHAGHKVSLDLHPSQQIMAKQVPTNEAIANHNM